MPLPRLATPIAAAILALGALVLSPQPGWAGLVEGRTAFRAGNLPLAYQEFLKGAETGDREAQYLVGNMLVNGQGTSQDVPRGLSWLERAGEAGHVGALMLAGTIYAFGDGVPIDYPRAISHLRPAAEAGDALAQHNLAVLLYYGLGTPPDTIQAMAWAIRAERQGLVQAIEFRNEIERTISPADLAKARETAASPTVARATPAAPPPAQAAKAQPQPQPQPPPATVTAPPPSRTASGPTMAEAAQTRPAPVAVTPAPSPAPVSATTMAAATSTPAPSGGDGWSVQLAALPSAAEAERQWSVLRRKLADVIGNQPMEIAVVDLAEKGVFHRILLGRFSDSGSARQFCDQVKSAGQDCLIRKR